MVERELPGTRIVEAREFLYVEASDRGAFENMFGEITDSPRDAMPACGGVITENATIVLPNGRQIHGLSYKGDIDGWRRVIQANVGAAGLLYARIVGDRVELSNGESVALEDCTLQLD